MSSSDNYRYLSFHVTGLRFVIKGLKARDCVIPLVLRGEGGGTQAWSVTWVESRDHMLTFVAVYHET